MAVALEKGHRSLAGGSSLPRLLAEHRGVRNRGELPTLQVETILSWADAHHARDGRWPKATSRPIAEAPDETWMRIHTALREGLRGLPGGLTLAQLLAQQRGVRNHKDLPRLSVEQIVGWAQAHQARTGRWPTAGSGQVEEAPNETWKNIEQALLQGLRGLPRGCPWPASGGRACKGCRELRANELALPPRVRISHAAGARSPASDGSNGLGRATWRPSSARPGAAAPGIPPRVFVVRPVAPPVGILLCGKGE
jgi:hypothetical protein